MDWAPTGMFNMEHGQWSATPLIEVYWPEKFSRKHMIEWPEHLNGQKMIHWNLRTNYLMLPDSIVSFLPLWRTWSTASVAWSHLVPKSCWKNYDGCLVMCLLISMSGDAFLLLKGALSALIDHAQSQKLMTNNTGKKDYSHLCSVTWLDAPPTGSVRPKKPIPKSHLYPLGTVKAVLP